MPGGLLSMEESAEEPEFESDFRQLYFPKTRAEIVVGGWSLAHHKAGHLDSPKIHNGILVAGLM